MKKRRNTAPGFNALDPKNVLPLKFINDRCKFVFGSLYSISPLLDPTDISKKYLMN